MGKYKGKKPKFRTNPVGLESMKEIILQAEETDFLEATKDSAFAGNLMDQIKSVSAEERDSGLNSLSVCCQNKEVLQSLLNNDLVKTVAPLLLDKSSMVRHSAAGALRNMSSLSTVVCDLMVEQDVMTPLLTLFSQYYTSAWSPRKAVAGKVDSDSGTFIQATTMLWNLCEQNEQAVKIFSQSRIIDSFVRYLDPKSFPIDVVLPVAQLFNTVCEDNAEVRELMVHLRPRLEEIIADGDSSSFKLAQLRVLCVGTLLNAPCKDSPITPDRLAYLAKYLATVLNSRLDLETIVSKANSEDSKEESTKSHSVTLPKNTEAMEHSECDELPSLDECEEAAAWLSTQTLAVTILSNILVSDEDGEVSDFDSEDSGSESFGDGADDMDYEDQNDIIPEEVLQILVTEHVPANVVKLALMYNKAFDALNKTEKSSRLVRLIRQLHVASLLCYQNIMEFLTVEQLDNDETNALLSHLPSVLEEIMKGNSQHNQIALLEAITSVMRAILQKWAESKVSKPLSWLSVGANQTFEEVYQRVTEAKIRTNIVKIIGWYGVLLSRQNLNGNDAEAFLNQLRQVGEFLLQCSCDIAERSSERLSIAAEALDSLFDVFAEDDHNRILSELNCIERLRKLQPQFKKYVHNQRRELKEHQAIIQTAKDNLARFIVYKSKMAC